MDVYSYREELIDLVLWVVGGGRVGLFSLFYFLFKFVKDYFFYQSPPVPGALDLFF